MCGVGRACENARLMSEAAPTTGPNGPANGDKCRDGDGRGTVAYVAVLAALALALVAAWAHHAGGVPTDLSFLVGAATFCGLLLLTSALPVRVAEHTEISAEGIVATIAVAALGPLWAVAASLPVALLAGRSDPLRGAYEASRRTVEACVAGARSSRLSERPCWPTHRSPCTLRAARGSG